MTPNIGVNPIWIRTKTRKSLIYNIILFNTRFLVTNWTQKRIKSTEL